ncbi:DNA-directed RNA polymerase subunit RPB5 [uncultured virus]|nr:DNA-directed RNA polymerase subunit RPB5 [uncultured virus]
MQRHIDQRLFDIKKTQLQLVADRGYEISQEEAVILDMNIDQFITYVNTIVITRNTSVRSALSRSYLSRDEINGVRRSMLVYYGGKTATQKQVSAEVVREFIALVQQYGIYEAILIVDASLSSTGTQELSALTLTRWQVFFDEDLTYNPTRHVDTPRHELLSPEEREAKLREMKTDISKLPIIQYGDPVVRYYGWVPGSIIRIHRDDSALSILAPKSINYRVVVGS